MTNRSRTLRNRSRVALALPVALLALAACSNDSSSTDSAKPSTGSESPSESGTSPGQSTSPSTKDDGGGSTGTDAKAGFVHRVMAATSGEQTAHVSMRMTGPTQMTASGVTGSGGTEGNRARLTMKLTSLGDRSIDLVLVHGAIYMAIEGVSPRGKFFKVPVKSQAAGIAGLTDGLSPENSLAALTKGLKSVRDLGPATIAGTATEQYRVQVDTHKATKGLGIATPGALPPTLTYTMWLGEDDHVRRMTYGLSGLQFTMDFTHWGEPVTVRAPSGSDLVAPPPGL